MSLEAVGFSMQENRAHEMFALLKISFVPPAVFVCLNVHTTTFCFNAEWSIALKACSVVS